MILYHGSNLKVREAKLIPSKRFLDFGMGFYLTSDEEQAKKWAVRTANRRESGTPTVSVFQVEEAKLENLQVLTFPFANRDWLRFVSAYRTGTAAEGGVRCHHRAGC